MISMMQNNATLQASTASSTPRHSTGTPSNATPTNTRAVVQRRSSHGTKLRYRHDPYQMATNAIVQSESCSNSSQQGLDSHGISPACPSVMPPCQPTAQAACDMSLESQEAYMSTSPIAPRPPQGYPNGCLSSDEMYGQINNNTQSSSEESGMSSHYHDMMAKLYDNSATAPSVARAPVNRQKKNTKQRSQQRKSAPAETCMIPAPAGRALLQQDIFAVIRFKYETAVYRCNFELCPGDVVVVEADRGENTGAVEEVTEFAPKFHVQSRVVRLADVNEMKCMKKQRNQQVITNVVRKTAKSIEHLNIQIIDTEMQADGNKLTVYYSADGYVDFRQFQRTLYRRFQCRIWLVNVNSVPTMVNKQ
jgi:hypothetical protein